MAVDLSVVIPIKNESPNLVDLHRELSDSLAAWGRSYELIFIDDGSTDDSFALLSRLAQADDHLRVIRFRRNFGQTPPSRRVCHGHRAGHRHLGWRPAERSRATSRCWSPGSTRGSTSSVDGASDRKDTFLTRRVPSIVANRLISRATGVDSARLRVLAEGVPGRGRQAAAALWRDAPVHPGHCQRDGRAWCRRWWSITARGSAGTSKYGLSRTIRVILDLLTVKFLLNYSTRPLQIFGLVGLSMGAARRR